MNTHGATVNRGEIVSMYAGLNAHQLKHSAVHVERENHKNNLGLKGRPNPQELKFVILDKTKRHTVFRLR